MWYVQEYHIVILVLTVSDSDDYVRVIMTYLLLDPNEGLLSLIIWFAVSLKPTEEYMRHFR